MKTFFTYFLFSMALLVNAQKNNFTIKVNNLPEESKLYLSPVYSTDYYENPINDSVINSKPKNSLLLNQVKFYYPYQISYQVEDNLTHSSIFIYLKDKDLHLNLPLLNSDFNTDIPEKKQFNEFFKDYIKDETAYNEYFGNNFLKYKFNLPTEIQDSVDKWFKRNWLNEIDLLEKYVEQYPKSNIALWKIIGKYEKEKNYPYEHILNKFDSSVKKSFPYNVLINKIEAYKIYAPGKKFPQIKTLKDIEGNNYQLNYSNQKYTLIDFWFHSCSPCIESFPDLKTTYEKYNSKGFEIIAISIDNTKYIPKWKNAITKYKLNWINVLDENREFTSKNQITAVPTNFLVDEEGKIIKNDISTQELNAFLENNLK